METYELEEEIFSALAGNSELVELLPNGAKSIFHYVAPATLKYPAIVYSPISDVPALSGDKNHGEVFAEDFIEKRCEFLAEVYGSGLTADKLLDELYLDEIIADYRAVTKYLIEQLTPKLEEVEKNASEGDAKTQ